MAVIISILLLNLKTKTINLPLIIPFYLNNGTFEIERESSESSELIHNEPWLKCLHFIFGTDFSKYEWNGRCCYYCFWGISVDSCMSPEVITDISSIDWILRYRKCEAARTAFQYSTTTYLNLLDRWHEVIFDPIAVRRIVLLGQLMWTTKRFDIAIWFIIHFYINTWRRWLFSEVASFNWNGNP